IVDAEIVDLNLGQLRGNLAGGIQCERVRAFQVRLCCSKLLGSRAILGHSLDLALDDGESIGCAVGLRRGAAEHDGGTAEPDQAVGYSVGKPAFLTHFLVEARRKTAAAKNVIDDVRRHELRVAARNALSAE